ncbi:hypothetical protein CDAR_620271 [Caerostris darwini]|uniref:Uncharacterized protein n=1 Tax=Caerostris darwini TaxID=1538125 RepID=A0AAV4VK44_9ARAC|nr:hypothetical protein CDAR_620271 [Caerostris darwini]
MRSRNVFWYSDPEFPKMGFRGTSSIKEVPNNIGGQYYRDGRRCISFFSELGVEGCSGRGCFATLCKKGVLIPIRITRQGGGGGGDRVELSGTHEERKKNYPVGE